MRYLALSRKCLEATAGICHTECGARAEQETVSAKCKRGEGEQRCEEGGKGRGKNEKKKPLYGSGHPTPCVSAAFETFLIALMHHN